VKSTTGRRLPRPGKWTAIVLGVLAGLTLIAVAGIAYAGYSFSRTYENKILPGAVVAGVDVGGMTRAEATRAVRKAVRPQLQREVTVTAGKRTWTTTPAELGARSTARRSVLAAIAASRDASFIEKTRMRVFGSQFDHVGEVAIRYPRAPIREFFGGIAERYNREPQDATIDYSTGWVKVVKEVPGREVKVAASAQALRRAFIRGGDTVDLAIKTEAPDVTSDAYDEVLLVRIGENKLYHYENGKIAHSWTVATGLPEYPTPSGIYSVTELRFMPTWVNPAPDGWGASMPAMIPPGPGNPLGLRAINWSASGIRFHGTSATYSLGYNASHGCVRMSNDDVIQLYEMVEVGTPIVSVEVAPYRPLYSSSSASSTPQAENSADAVDEEGNNQNNG
jgi:lipoprotein-anchoring transpeptidase ErfK/SrfK